MTRDFYFVAGLVALTLILVAQSVVLVPAHDAGPAADAEAVPAVVTGASDVTVVAIDDLAAWPAASGR
jgi:hypothetical protein